MKMSYSNNDNAVFVGNYRYLQLLISHFHPFSTIYTLGCTSGTNYTKNSKSIAGINKSEIAGSHYEKVSTANDPFSLAQKPLEKGRYFLVQPVVKKVGSFVRKHR